MMYVVEDACRPLFPHEVEPTKAEFAEAGVQVTTAAEAVDIIKATKGKEIPLAEYVAMASGMKGATKVAKLDGQLVEARVNGGAPPLSPTVARAKSFKK